MISDETDLYAILMQVRSRGCIIRSAACSPQEIAWAKAEGRLYVDRDGFGYVYRPVDPKS